MSMTNPQKIGSEFLVNSPNCGGLPCERDVDKHASRHIVQIEAAADQSKRFDMRSIGFEHAMCPLDQAGA